MRTLLETAAVFIALPFIAFSAGVWSATPAPPKMVVVTQSGQCYHSPGCPTLRNGKHRQVPIDAAAHFYSRCKVCAPPVAQQDPQP